jgi:CheY-like chemotaxis protein
VILSLAALNLDELETGTALHDDFREIRKAADRAAALTRQLLTFSRQQAVESRVLNVQDVVTDMDKMLERLVGEGVTLVSTTARPMGNVRIDPGNMGQIVMNLVVNARDAMPEGGRVTIELADVVLDSSYAHDNIDAKPGPHVMLAVTDTGHGMDKETQAKIFEPFFTTKDKGKGTGLGLSTVFGIVQQAGGSISVSSEVDVGTTFRIYLPRVDAALDRDQPSISPSSLRGNETVLLVEDEEQVRAAAHGILHRYGYQVLDASDGDEALRVFAGHSGTIDLVLSDVVMPRMGGPELAARLVAMRPGTKVLCMSGYTDEAVVGPEGLGSSVSFIQKPFEPKMLARKLREVLDARALVAAPAC